MNLKMYNAIETLRDVDYPIDKNIGTFLSIDDANDFIKNKEDSLNKAIEQADKCYWCYEKVSPKKRNKEACFKEKINIDDDYEKFGYNCENYIDYNEFKIENDYVYSIEEINIELNDKNVTMLKNILKQTER